MAARTGGAFRKAAGVGPRAFTYTEEEERSHELLCADWRSNCDHLCRGHNSRRGGPCRGPHPTRSCNRRSGRGRGRGGGLTQSRRLGTRRSPRSSALRRIDERRPPGDRGYPCCHRRRARTRRADAGDRVRGTERSAWAARTGAGVRGQEEALHSRRRHCAPAKRGYTSRGAWSRIGPRTISGGTTPTSSTGTSTWPDTCGRARATSPCASTTPTTTVVCSAGRSCMNRSTVERSQYRDRLAVDAGQPRANGGLRG